MFDLGEQTWAFVLGDVSGKGAEAATVSAATRYTLRALAGAASLPQRHVRKVNTSLLGHTDVERHCTLVYGQLRPDGEGTTVVFTLAGHHPPIVLRTTGEVEEVGTLGTALALFDEPDLHDTTVHLAPGNLMCIFTDGLVEARRGREMFGGERVAALLNRSVDRPAAELSHSSSTRSTTSTAISSLTTSPSWSSRTRSGSGPRHWRWRARGAPAA